MPDGIDLWMMTVRCGRCGRPSTLASFEKREGGWNRYVYECEQGCPPEAAKSIVEVPQHIDHTTRRREEIDYPDPADGFVGPGGAMKPEDIENPEKGVFCADPPEEDEEPS